MKHIRLAFFMAFSFLSVHCNAQLNYDTLMDSLKSETYIGMVVNLQEVQVNDSLVSKTQKQFSFYKTNKLNSTDDVLSRLPGVSMIKRGNYAWEPTIHGLSGNQININIDGMRVFGACTDKMDPVTSYIEPNNMASIKVSHGIDGAAYGCTAGGSVAFQTMKPKFKKGVQGNFSSRFESVSLGQSHLGAINISDRKWAVRLNGAFRKSQNYRSGGGVEVPFSSFQKANYAASLNYMLTRNSLLSFDFLGDDASDVGYPALPMDVAYAKAKMFGLSYDLWEPIEGIEHLEFKVYSNSVQHAMDDSQRSNVVVRMDMPGNTETYGSYVNADIHIKKHKLQTKLEYYYSSAYAEMTMFIGEEVPMFMQTWPQVDRSDFGLYVKDEYTSGSNSLSFSGRLDYADTRLENEFGKRQFSVFGYNEEDMGSKDLFYNVGSAYARKWGQGFESKISYNQGTRLPSVSEQFGFYLFNSQDGYDYIGNPNIEKEQSHQISIESAYGISTLEIRFNGFYYWFDNYILGKTDFSLDAMTIGSNGVRKYENISGVTFKGFDARVFYNPLANLNLMLSSTLTIAEDGMGTPIPLIPPLKSNLTLLYKLPWLKIQSELIWATQQNQINMKFGERRTPGYLISNIRLDKELPLEDGGLKLSAGVENLFDKKYREHLDWGNIMRPGRNIYFSLSYSFE
ncbi:MAG: TonB-dependent receptor [Cyclobacteriaceae bacterium]